MAAPTKEDARQLFSEVQDARTRIGPVARPDLLDPPPILVVVDRTEEDRALTSLVEGADAYLLRPFESHLLNALVCTLWQRAGDATVARGNSWVASDG